MPYRLIWEKNGLVEVYSGEVTGPEMNRLNELVAADPRFDSLWWIIADVSDASATEDLADYYEEGAAMAYAASRSNNRIIIAVVAPDPKMAKIAARFQEYPSPFPYRIFSSMEAAREWIWANTCQ